MTHVNVYFFTLPLALSISLVYAASRHESWRLILSHASRLVVMILGILVVSTVVLLLINSQLL